MAPAGASGAGTRSEVDRDGRESGAATGSLPLPLPVTEPTARGRGNFNLKLKCLPVCETEVEVVFISASSIAFIVADALFGMWVLSEKNLSGSFPQIPSEKTGHTV